MARNEVKETGKNLVVKGKVEKYTSKEGIEREAKKVVICLECGIEVEIDLWNLRNNDKTGYLMLLKDLGLNE